MKVILKQDEIDNILAAHINKNGISTVGKTITTTYTAGRRNSGLSVEIEISDNTSEPPAPTEAINRSEEAAPVPQNIFEQSDA